MMQPGDIVMVFASPIKREHPIDQAKLIEKRAELSSNMEEWWVEYLNDPDKHYIALIPKEENGTDKKEDA